LSAPYCTHRNCNSERARISQCFPLFQLPITENEERDAQSREQPASNSRRLRRQNLRVRQRSNRNENAAHNEGRKVGASPGSVRCRKSSAIQRSASRPYACVWASAGGGQYMSVTARQCVKIKDAQRRLATTSDRRLIIGPRLVRTAVACHSRHISAAKAIRVSRGLELSVYRRMMYLNLP
jgi:hypothetical protein